MPYRMWVSLTHSHFICDPTCLSICTLQFVSAPYIVAFFLYSNFFIYIFSLECESLLLAPILFMLRLVHLSEPFRMWATFTHSHPFMSQLVCLFMLSRVWVPLIHLDYFYVLTYLSIYALQDVSVSSLPGFFLYSYLSLGCKCPLLA